MELRRQAYLSALGIESYMPRWQLGNAPLSIACEMPVAIENKDAVPRDAFFDGSIGTPAVVSQEPRDAVVIGDVLRNLVEPAKAAKPVAKMAEVNRVAPSTDAAPRFSLSIWRPLDQWLVIDSRDAKAALPTEALLGNIMSALGGSTANKLQEEIWHWPIVDNVIVPFTADDARDALSAWLDAELDKRPCTRVLIMGEVAFRYLNPAERHYSDMLWQQTSAGNGVIHLYSPSLVSLLRDPSSKRNLWQLLSSLR